MTTDTSAQLRAKIEQLEAENSALKSTATPAKFGRRKSWAWALLSTVLIVIGALLAPVAVIGSWVNVSLTNTDQFVATYAPLSESPAVQAYVASTVTDAIQEQVDIPALTNGVIDGIVQLGTGPVATRALEALRGPAAAGIASLIESGVDRFVASDAFSTVWAQTLRVSHSQLIAAMTGERTGAVVVSDTGEIGIELAPVIEAVKTALVDQGLTFAEQIPTVNRTIVVAQSDALPLIQLGYRLAVDGGFWLPLVALLFLVAGVLVARRRSVALIGAAIALALSMGLTLAAFGVGGLVFLATTSSVVPSSVASVLFASVTSAMQQTAISVLVVAIVVAVIAWLAGPFRTPTNLRELASAGAGSIRAAGEARGLSTGAAGEWMFRQRLLLRIAIAVGAAAIVLLVRPMSPALTLSTLLVGAILLGLLEVLHKPTDQTLDAK